MDAEGKQAVLQMKYARIIAEIARRKGIDEARAMETFYTSETFPLIDAGIADLHCRSDEYLAGEILAEKEHVDEC